MSTGPAPVTPAQELARPWRWEVRLPAMVVAFLVLGGAIGAAVHATSSSPLLAVVAGPVLAAAALAAYVLAVRWSEKRPVTEVARAGALRGLLGGVALGAALFGLVVAVLAATGTYRVTGAGSVTGALTILGMMTAVAVSEEIVFRGVVLRLLAERLGDGRGLAVSAVLFGAVHLANPGASLWGAVAIAIEGGLLLGAAYQLTRTLWLPIGLHLAWNVVQGGVFGSTVSGADGLPSGLLEAELSGPTWLSGGALGAEGSVVTVVVCAVAAVVLLRRRARQSSGETSPLR
jgi:uncharacterized protein